MPEYLRGIVLAVNLMFVFGGFLVGLSAVSLACVGAFVAGGWLVPSFPFGSFILASIVLVIVGWLMVHAAWWLRIRDPRIGEAVANSLGWMGVKPEQAQVFVKPAAPAEDRETKTK